MRVLLADPPAFTPPYDHALASALARAGCRGRARHVAVSLRRGARARRLPALGALLSRELEGLPAIAPAHPGEAARAPGRAHAAEATQGRRRPPPVAGRARSSTTGSSAVDAPLVFTAHDILPRRTARQSATSGGGSSAVSRGCVVHSERARDQLAELVEPAPPPGRSRIPVFASEPRAPRRRPHAPLLGIIREYKGLGDAIEATKRIDGARLLVAGDPLESIGRLPRRRR